MKSMLIYAVRFTAFFDLNLLLLYSMIDLLLSNEFKADFNSNYFAHVGILSILIGFPTLELLFSLLQQFFEIYFVFSLDLLLNVSLEKPSHLVAIIICNTSVDTFCMR